MKALSIRSVAVLAACILLAVSCKKDDPKPDTSLSVANLKGFWTISSGEGTEWKEGTGVITPRAPFTDVDGWKLEITDTQITVRDGSGVVQLGPISYTLNASTKVLSAGNGNTGLGVYTINNFVAGASMDWDQREPIAEDYEAEAGCSCNLSFQKFLKFTKS